MSPDSAITAPAALAGEEAVHLAQHVGDAVIARRERTARRLQVVGVRDALAMAAQALALQRAHEVADADVGVGVAAHVRRGCRPPRSTGRA